jgi:hypothetical protein
MKRACLALLCCVALAACDDAPRFDASSLPAYQKSLRDIKATLSARDQQRLDMALITQAAGSAAGTLPPADPQLVAVLSALDGVANPLIYLDRLRPKIDGRSAAKVIALVADDLDFAISRAEQQSAGTDKILAAVTVENPRYYWNRGKNSDQPSIEFSVANRGASAITGITVNGVLTMHGRAEPLAAGHLYYVFWRALQPSEQRPVMLVPDPRSAWANKNLETAYDADLMLKVTNFSDTTGKRLLATDADIVEAMKRKRDFLRGN